MERLPTEMPSGHADAARGGGHLNGRTGRLEDVCADFEAIFIGFMMKALRRTIPESGFSAAPGRDIYALMFDQKVAEDLSTGGGGIGLQQILLRQLGARDSIASARGTGSPYMPSAGGVFQRHGSPGGRDIKA